MQKAGEEPVFEIEKFAPKRFMEFTSIQANQSAGNALGELGNGGKDQSLSSL
jgi:hypothetical protein